jgi:SAM-dependent methyltransferase
MSNRIKDILCALKLSDEDSIEEFFPCVRDRKDVRVLRCRKSGAILLSGTEHIESAHYTQQQGLKYWGGPERAANLLVTLADDRRRADQFRSVVAGKIWLDIGTGLGGILDQLAPVAGKILAVEPQPDARKSLESLGYPVFADIRDVQDRAIDVVSLFHVFEHIADPVEFLRAVRGHMKPGGKLIVEVPHAHDLLIASARCEAFMAFTFWSEHLILHTRLTLEAFLKAAGFKNIVVEGFQRYPLANHLHWLAKGKPKGHILWAQFSSEALDRAYADMLKQLDQTDTLIATAEVD